MFGKIFGKKEELKDMIVYWQKDVKVDDMVHDLNILGSLMVKPSAFTKGCRIVTVRPDIVNSTQYLTAELVVDKGLEKTICGLIRNHEFAAVEFSETIM